MSAATLDQLWHRLQRIPFSKQGEFDQDEEICEYLTLKVQEWWSLTRQWQDALTLPKDSLFTLAQDVVINNGSPHLPQEIGEWLASLYKEPPMFWRGASKALALIEGALLWKLSEEKNFLFGNQINNPYEPIIDFFEWGGWIYHEHGVLTDFNPTRIRIMLNAGVRESAYDTRYREYWESLSKNQKKNKNRSMRNLK